MESTETPTSAPWYYVRNLDTIDSPALLVYRDRVIENIRRMIVIAGGTERLRPHVKTHKMPEIVRIQMDMGISRFKCATIAEAEMLANAGAPDILLAYQPTGPKITRLLQLAWNFPGIRFAALTDDARTAKAISAACQKQGVSLDLYLDLDVGMHRTGIAPDKKAQALAKLIQGLPRLNFAGLHVYDGHIRDSDVSVRKQRCDTGFEVVEAFQTQLEAAAGIPVPEVVAGGTPTFPIHAQRPGITLSPGTCALWDGGYERILPDLDFLHAALVLTRVISKPTQDRLCIDLGHKSIAAENPHPRVYLFEMEDVQFLGQSEEHLVITCKNPDAWQVGDAIYGVPHHICPTTALYESVIVVENRRPLGRWRVEARDRILGV